MKPLSTLMWLRSHIINVSVAKGTQQGTFGHMIFVKSPFGGLYCIGAVPRDFAGELRLKVSQGPCPEVSQGDCSLKFHRGCAQRFRRGTVA